MALTSRKSKPLSRGGAAFLGLIFAGLGIFFIGYGGVPIAAEVWKVRHWEEVSCTVKKADLGVTVDADGVANLKPLVEYTFTWKDQAITSNSFAAPYTGPGVEPNREANEWEESLAAHRTPGDQKCLVNPDDPREAVLEKPGYGQALIFIAAGGLVLLVAGLFVRRAFRGPPAVPISRSIWLLLIPAFSSIFLATGGVCFWLALRDDWKEVAPRLQEVPCTIEASRVKTTRTSSRAGGNRITYSPDILFRYDWEGHAWHSGWVDFSRNSVRSSDPSTAEDTVKRYARGSAQKCWVDPERPWVAVLEKNYGPAWVLWLCGSVFGGIGVLGLVLWFGRGFLFRRFKKPSSAP